MRIGAPLFDKYVDPDTWVAAVKRKGYHAAYCPVGLDADDDTVAAYAKAAKNADLAISEVGAWSNPMSPDETTRKEALQKCKQALSLADRIGARVAVNIAGSRGEKWDGPSAEDLTEETFEMIVETTREIIDAVNPSRSCYALETMPWMYPDSPDSYVRLIDAIDRKQLGVHFDPVNMIHSPQRYFRNGDFMRECFSLLWDKILSRHAKDILLRDRLTVHLDEVCPGDGALDYRVFLTELDKLDPDIPLMLEHMKEAADYDRG